MTPLTAIEVAQHLLNADFQGWEIRTMGAICMAESGRNPHAHGLNDNTPSSVAYLSEDHGLFQINDYWGPVVLSSFLLTEFITTERSFSQISKNPDWSAKAAREMFELRWLQSGSYVQGFTCWSAYNNNKHLPFMKEAYEAAKAVGAI